MQRRGHVLTAVSAVLAAVAMTGAIRSETLDHFIAMRAPDVEPVPRYVSLSLAQTPERTIALTGCDGQTYWVVPSTASAVQAALRNGNTVQLYSVSSGNPPEQGSVVCLFQSSK